MIRAISSEDRTGGGAMGPADLANPENGRPSAGVTPATNAGVVDYAGRPPTAGPRWDRGPDGLVLTLPPPPAWRRLVAPAAVLAGATALAVVPVALATSLPAEPKAWPIILLLALTVVGLWVMALRRLLHTARHARLSSTIRVDAAGLSMTVADSPADEWLQWPREQVRDLRVTATGVLPLIQEYLWVRVERQPPGAAATVIVVRIPWAMPLPPAGRVAGIEETLREAVGLPPMKRSTPAGG